MDDVQLLTKSLHSAIQRTVKQAQNYEIEITNMTAELLKLQAELEDKEIEIKTLRDHIKSMSAESSAQQNQ